MALGLMTLKARLKESLERPPSSVRAVRTRASRSAPTKPWAAWATFRSSSWLMSALESLSANFVRMESLALVLGTQTSISTSRRPKGEHFKHDYFKYWTHWAGRRGLMDSTLSSGDRVRGFKSWSRRSGFSGLFSSSFFLLSSLSL